MGDRVVPFDKVKGLRFWFDASKGTFQDTGFSTPATANNDPVGGWRDQSSFGTDVIQASAGLRPLLKTAMINGLPAILPNGSTQYLQSTVDAAMGIDMWVVATIRRTWSTSGAYMVLFGNEGNTNAQGTWLFVNSQALNDAPDHSLIFNSCGYAEPPRVSCTMTQAGLTDDVFYTFGFVVGMYYTEIYVNGVAKAVLKHGGYVGTPTSQGLLNIFRNSAANPYPVDCYLAEMQIGVGQIEPSDLKRVMKYQGTKYGTF